MRLLRFDIDPVHTTAVVCATIVLAMAIAGCSGAPPSAKSPSGTTPATSSASAPLPDEEPAAASELEPYPGPQAPSGMYTTTSGRTIVVGVLAVQDIKVNGISTVLAKVVADSSAAGGTSRPLARLDVPDESMAATRKLDGTRVTVEGALSDAAVAGQTPFLTLETIKAAPAP